MTPTAVARSAILSPVSGLRRLVLSILLACLPLQAVVGATGIVCAFAGHAANAPDARTTHTASSRDGHDAHDANMSSGHAARTAYGSGGHPHGAATHATAGSGHADTHDATYVTTDHSGNDTCRFCMECCTNAAPVSVIGEIRPGPARLLRLPSFASPVHATQSGDVLYRPPRTSAV